MTEPVDSQQPMAAAMVWVSRIFAISLEMIVPGIVAQKLGARWGMPGLVLPGFLIGISLGLGHLILMTRAAGRDGQRSKKQDPPRSE